MNYINSIINIFYPNVCGICDKICRYDICPKCIQKLNQIKQCKKHIYLKKDFSTHMYIFKYGDIIRKNIINYKFHEQNYKYKSFVNFMKKNKKIYNFIKRYDIIIPVPISKKRKQKRGYNQSELILKELAKQDKSINFTNKILFKIKDTAAQSSLDKEKRLVNLKGAYKVENSNQIANKKILLFDDIYTTGSTANECARVLKQAGAYEIRCFDIGKRLKRKEYIK